MNLKSLIKRFRAWQEEPFKREKKAPKSHVCVSCGNTFEGNYCPICGQRHDVGKVNWSTIWDDVKSIIGLDKPKSVVSFLVQLFGRPGYMSGDYVSGRRNMYSSPIAMLGVIAASALLIGGHTVHAKTGWVDSLAEGGGVAGAVLTWLSSHLEWTVLIQTIFLIFPTWLLFRHAPRHTRHTLPQGIYIQVFMGSLVIICIILRNLLGEWALALIPLFYFFAYRQLFGYGIWATLWRTLLSLGSILYFFGVIMMVFMYVSGRYTSTHSTGAIIAMVVLLLALGAGLLVLGWWIDKKNAGKQSAA